MLAEAYYDVALLKVNKEIEFSIVIYPICLPPEDLLSPEEILSKR